MPDDAGENPKPSQTPESKGQAPNPKEAQSGGVNINTAGDAAIRGDAVGHDKIVATTTTAGGHIIQAEAGATIIVGATRAAPTAEDEAPAPGESPFKGLQYFDEADAELFFGREMLTAKLVGQLHKHRFLAVVGGSGSGKSSLVRAGLIPALKRGETLADGTLPPDGSINWLIYIITPSAHPLEELATALIPPSEPVKVITTFMDDLANDPRNLHFAVRRALGRVSAGKFVLIVDQFEELFTLCRSEVESKTFVDSLLYATAPDTDGTTIVVITLRADFCTHCAQFANLREALAKQQEYIGPLSATELRRAIEEPAKRGGWTFAPSLVSSLLRDVSNEPGALPLLSHALLETWKRRRGRTITHNGYAESGGVRGAIAKTAEAVFNQRLTPEQQIIARNIFLRLTELGKGTHDTCRRATLAELIPRPEDTLIVESILKILADARLITTSERTVEVAHEALIREWPKLREWLGQNCQPRLASERVRRGAETCTDGGPAHN
ncbi:MAG: hypothetical protein HZB17_13585 [Chloroflexi bacterium]|nr:hypothetical protein [Chloroflexota bacterium]